MKRNLVLLAAGVALVCGCGSDGSTTPTGPDPAAPESVGARAASPAPESASASAPTTRLQSRPCSDELSLRSTEANTLTSIEFQNASGGERRVYWLNYNGGRVLYNTLVATAAYRQPTFLTHPWVVTDSSGACVSIYVPTAVPTTVVLEPASAAPPVPAATTRSCADVSQLKSTEGRVRTAIQFVNQTAGGVKVLWINYAGQTIPYNTLNAGASYTQQTFVTNPWVVTDTSDRCLTVILPLSEPSRAVIQ